ncbi:unnamed protein product [Prorocentrum cordatum]|uniref:Uncharacterized protein n=1 Tax=Prorocentrum cordatum TaxID=2364126 RepID=A0ABN9TEL4_9DINO|nr:unnamed protein product [Polarella glacialis]
MSVPVKDELQIRSVSSDDVLLGLGPITLSPEDDPERESGWFASPEHDMALEGCSAHGNTADEEVAAENVKEEIEDAEAAEQPAVPAASQWTTTLIDLTSDIGPRLVSRSASKATARAIGDSAQREASGIGEEMADEDEGEYAARESDGDGEIPSTTLDPARWQGHPTPLSLDEEFPRGTAFQHLARIRKTVNGYVDGLCSVDWHKDFMAATVGALTRRLMTHESKIMGKAVLDVQVCSKQLEERAKGLLAIHKWFHQWTQFKTDDKLVEALPHLMVELKYLKCRGLEVAPPVGLVTLKAIFFSVYMESGSVAKAAIGHINLGSLRRVLEMSEEYMTKLTEVRNSAPQAPAAEGAAPGRRHRGRLLPIDDAVDITLPVAVQLGIMVWESLEHYWQSIGAKGEMTMDTRMQVVDETSSIWRSWVNTFETEEKTMDTTQVETALCSVRVVCQCLLPDEKDKPTTADVRAARKFINQNATSTKSSDDQRAVVQNIAKSMVGIAPAIFIMEQARRHASKGVEDDAATAIFDKACNRFEESFQEAYTDMELFINEPKPEDESDVMTYAILGKRLKPIIDIQTSIISCASRWSPAALKDNIEPVCAAMGNFMELLSNGVYGLVSVFHKTVSRPLARVLDETGATKGGAGFAAVSPASKVIAALGDLHATRLQSEEFYKALQTMVLGTTKCAEALTKRTSDVELAEKLGEIGCAKVLLATLEDNRQNLKDMMDYMGAVVELLPVFVDGGSDALFDATTTNPKTKEHTINLSRLQHQLEGVNTILFHGESTVQDASVFHSISEAFMIFKANFGDITYHHAAAVWLAPRVVNMLAFSDLEIGAVQDDVLVSTLDAQILGRLVRKPGADDPLPSEVVEALQTTADSDTMLESFTHNKALTALKDFAEATSMTEMRTCGAALADGRQGEDWPVPMHIATYVFDVMCAVRDQFMLATALQHYLIDPTAERKEMFEKSIEPHPSCNIQVNALVLMFSRAKVIDDLVNADAGRSLERDGWSLRIPLQSLGRWALQMASCAGRCRDAVMAHRMTYLSAVVSECQSTMPQWESIFKDGVLNMKMAIDLLDEKLPPTVASYNRIYQVLGKVSVISKRIELSPPVDKHPTTSSGCAVASTLLAKFYQATVLTQGVNLLGFQSQGPSASTKASSFIKEHQEKKKVQLPDAFWSELKCIVDGSAMLPDAFWSELKCIVDGSAMVFSDGHAVVKREGAPSEEREFVGNFDFGGDDVGIVSEPRLGGEATGLSQAPAAKRPRLARLSGTKRAR